MNTTTELTVGGLLDELEFDRADHDETLRWALLELKLRREASITIEDLEECVRPADKTIACWNCGAATASTMRQERAADIGMELAEKEFRRRGCRVEAHVTKKELAALIGLGAQAATESAARQMADFARRSGEDFAALRERVAEAERAIDCGPGRVCGTVGAGCQKCLLAWALREVEVREKLEEEIEAVLKLWPKEHVVRVEGATIAEELRASLAVSAARMAQALKSAKSALVAGMLSMLDRHGRISTETAEDFVGRLVRERDEASQRTATAQCERNDARRLLERRSRAYHALHADHGGSWERCPLCEEDRTALGDGVGLGVPPASAGVTIYAPAPSGARMSAFEMEGVRVQVLGADPEDTERAFQLACRLASAGFTLGKMQERIDQLQAQVRRLAEQVKPPRPAQVLGRGYVRFDPSDRSVWALNRREAGWGEFGFRFESWDELFRRFDVRVVEHGADQHGPWWAFEPMPKEGT